MLREKGNTNDNIYALDLKQTIIGDCNNIKTEEIQNIYRSIIRRGYKK